MQYHLAHPDLMLLWRQWGLAAVSEIMDAAMSSCGNKCGNGCERNMVKQIFNFHYIHTPFSFSSPYAAVPTTTAAFADPS